jgi:hypothetical protein
MDQLPDVRTDDDSLSPRQAARAIRIARSNELRVFQHAVRARARAEMDQADGQAMADAMRGAMDEEMDLLDYGLRRAAGSPAKAELVARKVEMLSNANNRRLQRRFGA